MDAGVDAGVDAGAGAGAGGGEDTSSDWSYRVTMEERRDHGCYNVQDSIF